MSNLKIAATSVELLGAGTLAGGTLGALMAGPDHALPGAAAGAGAGALTAGALLSTPVLRRLPAAMIRNAVPVFPAASALTGAAAGAVVGPPRGPSWVDTQGAAAEALLAKEEADGYKSAAYRAGIDHTLRAYGLRG